MGIATKLAFSWLSLGNKCFRLVFEMFQKVGPIKKGSPVINMFRS